MSFTCVTRKLKHHRDSDQRQTDNYILSVCSHLVYDLDVCFYLVLYRKNKGEKKTEIMFSENLLENL